MPLHIDAPDPWLRSVRSVNALFTARVRPGRIDIFRDGATMVDSFSVPAGARLRDVLATNGWRPTGRSLRNGAHADLIVEAIKQSRS